MSAAAPRPSCNTSCDTRWDNAYLVDNLRRFLSKNTSDTHAQLERIRVAEAQVASLQQELQDKKIQQDKQSLECKQRLVQNAEEISKITTINKLCVEKQSLDLKNQTKAAAAAASVAPEAQSLVQALEFAAVVQSKVVIWMLQQERQTKNFIWYTLGFMMPFWKTLTSSRLFISNRRELAILSLTSRTTALDLTSASKPLDDAYRTAYRNYEDDPNDEKAIVSLESALLKIGNHFAARLSVEKNQAVTSEIESEIEYLQEAFEALQNQSPVNQYRKGVIENALRYIKTELNLTGQSKVNFLNFKHVLASVGQFERANEFDFKSVEFQEEIKKLREILPIENKDENYQKAVLAIYYRIAQIIRGVAKKFGIVVFAEE